MNEAEILERKRNAGAKSVVMLEGNETESK